MRFLLDTHAAIRWFEDSLRLTDRACATVQSETNEIYVSAATAWEIATKHRLGKPTIAPELAADIRAAILRQRFQPLAITMSHAEVAGRLAGSHRDPLDRMLIAQSILEGLTLVSNETRFEPFVMHRVS